MLQEQVYGVLRGRGKGLSTWEVAKMLQRTRMQDLAYVGKALRALESKGLVQCTEVISGHGLIRVWSVIEGR